MRLKLHQWCLQQVIKLTGLERTRGMARLCFVAGDRVICALSGFLTLEASLNKVSLVPSSLLSIPFTANLTNGIPILSYLQYCVPQI